MTSYMIVSSNFTLMDYLLDLAAFSTQNYTTVKIPSGMMPLCKKHVISEECGTSLGTN